MFPAGLHICLFHPHAVQFTPELLVGFIQEIIFANTYPV